ncbi:hypothetical protein DFH09DRAFT_580399 [Mycena vulgaris]|nr:hypothetical protein DFH09DRAFT_1370770 [Mycena vulgaris]KAJ6553940.1 hypothetical protein DFH09DRAFT_580399 [Mycena vulgaris]
MFLLLGQQACLSFNHIAPAARFFSRPHFLSRHRRDTLHHSPSMDQESLIRNLSYAAERALRARNDRSYHAKAKDHALRIAISDEDQFQRLINLGDLGLEASLFFKFQSIVTPPFDPPTVQSALVESIAALLKNGVGFPIPTTFQPVSLFTAILGVLIQDHGLGGKDSKDRLGAYSHWVQQELGDVIEEVQRTATNFAAEIEGGIDADQLASLTKQYSMLDVSDTDWDGLSLFTLTIDGPAIATTGVKRKGPPRESAAERRKIRRLHLEPGSFDL